VAGIGPPPKDRRKRARVNSDPVPLRIVHAQPVGQPDLPTRRISNLDLEWPEQTAVWWAMWGESPLSAEFTSTDWAFLLDTAWLHAALWSGDMKVAAELRLRVAKFGATPEDRARLRITFADADEKDEKRTSRQGGDARARYGGAGRAVGSD
jgi:hypothetical protein